jgi:DNA-binding response OmpR family regulator
MVSPLQVTGNSSKPATGQASASWAEFPAVIDAEATDGAVRFSPEPSAFSSVLNAQRQATMSTSPKPLILIVEDEPELANIIAQQLESVGMQTQVYHRCALALRFLKKNFANLVLLDITLPDQDGFSFLDELKRSEVNVPVIFLTGNDSEVSKVKGLDLGADDYVTKPFSAAELIARIHAVLRRAESSHDFNVTKNARISDSPFAFEGASIDPRTLTATFTDGTTEKLGRKEFGIIAYLASNPGVIITRKNLIHSVWGLHADVRSRSLDQYIVKIRDLFGRKGRPLGNLRTVHGIGYEFSPSEPADSAAAETTSSTS